MKKRLIAVALVLLGILTSLVSVQAQSIEEQVDIINNAVSDVEFHYLTEKILEQGVYNAELNRMEYIVESSNEATVFGNANDIRVIRTVYAYYYLNGRQHKVDVIHVKRQGNETWEETIRSYNDLIVSLRNILLIVTGLVNTDTMNMIMFVQNVNTEKKVEWIKFILVLERDCHYHTIKNCNIK